jgi:hypothetical protein
MNMNLVSLWSLTLERVSFWFPTPDCLNYLVFRSECVAPMNSLSLNAAFAVRHARTQLNELMELNELTDILSRARTRLFLLR